MSLRELYETDDPGFVAYVSEVTDQTVEMREAAWKKNG